MKGFKHVVITLLLCGVAFWSGTKWIQLTLGTLPSYELTQAVTLQQSPSEIGSLPTGTTVYEFRASGETTTYILFFNLKNQMMIEPIHHEHWNTIAPLDGYVE